MWPYNVMANPLMPFQQGGMPGYGPPGMNGQPQMPPMTDLQKMAMLGTSLGGLLSNMGDPGIVGRRKGVLGALGAIAPAMGAQQRQGEEAEKRGLDRWKQYNDIQGLQRENETRALLERTPAPEGFDEQQWRVFARVAPAKAFEFAFGQQSKDRERKRQIEILKQYQGGDQAAASGDGTVPAGDGGGYNVGNIRAAGGGFRTFASPEDAVRATVANVQAYPKAFNQGQPMTLLQIGERWAPYGDGANDPAAWARNVAAGGGLPVDVPIDLSNPQVQARFAKGVHLAEFGPKKLYADDVYQRAVSGQTAASGQRAPADQVAQAGGVGPVPTQGQAPAQTPGQPAAPQSLPPGIQEYDRIMRDAKRAENIAVQLGDQAQFQAARKAYNDAAKARQQAVQQWSRAEIDQPTENVIGPDGKPIVAPRRQAYGKEPYVKEIDPRVREANIAAQAAQGVNKAELELQNAGTLAERQALGKKYGEMAATAVDRGMTAGSRIQRLNMLDNLVDRINTGKLTPAEAQGSAWLRAVGIDPKSLGLDPNLPASTEAATSIIGTLMVQQIGQGEFPANNFSDADREFLLRNLPGLANRPEANKLIIYAMRSMAQREADHAREWLRAQKAGKSYGEFLGDWMDKVGKEELFSKEKIEALMPPQPRGGAGVGPGGAAPAAPPKQFDYVPGRGLVPVQ